MATRGQQQRKRGGLADTVQEVAANLRDVVSVSIGAARMCCGTKKVKVPNRWPIVFPTTLAFVVYDGDKGTREVLVRTTKPWAIIVAIEGRLRQQGINVC